MAQMAQILCQSIGVHRPLFWLLWRSRDSQTAAVFVQPLKKISPKGLGSAWIVLPYFSMKAASEWRDVPKSTQDCSLRAHLGSILSFSAEDGKACLACDGLRCSLCRTRGLAFVALASFVTSSLEGEQPLSDGLERLVLFEVAWL